MKQKKSGIKIICLNRKASFNYFLQDILEAGIVLKRSGKVNIAESYVVEKDQELFLINSHIPLYSHAGHTNHDPMGERKLLLNKREISKLLGKINKDGLSLIPLKMYFRKGKAKLEIAVGKGKKRYDKRQTKKRRDWDRVKARFFRKSS